MRIPHPRRAAVAVLTGALVVSAIAASQSSAAVTPSFSLTADHSAIALNSGAQTAFRVAVVSQNSWHGTVAFSVTGAPSHTKIAITPAAKVATGSSAAFAVVPTGKVAAGHYSLRVTAQAGSTTHRLTEALTVTGSTAMTWSVDPDFGRAVESYGVSYHLTLNRAGVTSAFAMSTSGLPRGVSATYNHPTMTGSTNGLRVQLSNDVVPGTYRFWIKARSSSRSVSIPAYLQVLRHHFRNFAISGNLDRLLAPGVTGLLNLKLTNPFSHSMQVRGITVKIAKINRSSCGLSNFQLTQYSGPVPLVVPSHSTRSLSELHVANSAMPKLKMLNLNVNQDACKNTVVTLSYAGSGIDK
jgi:hypothetical protein